MLKFASNHTEMLITHALVRKAGMVSEAAAWARLWGSEEKDFIAKLRREVQPWDPVTRSTITPNEVKI